ncbi:MAG: hypothetical protein R2822_13000 [Spirosomataceae bacterium]
MFQTTEVTFEDFKHKLPEETMKKVMSTYDRILAEGMEKGIEKTILNAFDNDLSLETIRVITGESIEKIKVVLQRNNRIVQLDLVVHLISCNLIPIEDKNSFEEQGNEYVLKNKLKRNKRLLSDSANFEPSNSKMCVV